MICREIIYISKPEAVKGQYYWGKSNRKIAEERLGKSGMLQSPSFGMISDRLFLFVRQKKETVRVEDVIQLLSFQVRS